MKSICQLCATVVLMLALALSAFAGQMQTGKTAYYIQDSSLDFFREAGLSFVQSLLLYF